MILAREIEESQLEVRVLGKGGIHLARACQLGDRFRRVLGGDVERAELQVLFGAHERIGAQRVQVVILERVLVVTLVEVELPERAGHLAVAGLHLVRPLEHDDRLLAVPGNRALGQGAAKFQVAVRIVGLESGVRPEHLRRVLRTARAEVKAPRLQIRGRIGRVHLDGAHERREPGVELVHSDEGPPGEVMGFGVLGIEDGRLDVLRRGQHRDLLPLVETPEIQPHPKIIRIRLAGSDERLLGLLHLTLALQSERHPAEEECAPLLEQGPLAKHGQGCVPLLVLEVGLPQRIQGGRVLRVVLHRFLELRRPLLQLALLAEEIPQRRQGLDVFGIDPNRGLVLDHRAVRLVHLLERAPDEVMRLRPVWIEPQRLGEELQRTLVVPAPISLHALLDDFARRKGVDRRGGQEKSSDHERGQDAVETPVHCASSAVRTTRTDTVAGAYPYLATICCPSILVTKLMKSVAVSGGFPRVHREMLRRSG